MYREYIYTLPKVNQVSAIKLTMDGSGDKGISKSSNSKAKKEQKESYQIPTYLKVSLRTCSKLHSRG